MPQAILCVQQRRKISAPELRTSRRSAGQGGLGCVDSHVCYRRIAHTFIEPQTLWRGLQNSAFDPISFAGSIQSLSHNRLSIAQVAVAGEGSDIVEAHSSPCDYRSGGRNRFPAGVTDVPDEATLP